MRKINSDRRQVSRNWLGYSVQEEKLYVQQKSIQTALDFKCLLHYNDVIQWHAIRCH